MTRSNDDGREIKPIVFLFLYMWDWRRSPVEIPSCQRFPLTRFQKGKLQQVEVGDDVLSCGATPLSSSAPIAPAMALIDNAYTAASVKLC